jgi:hypothetical protein
MRHLPVLLLLIACNNESKVGVYVQPPAVTISNPADGSIVDQSVPIFLQGLVTDDAFSESLDQLEATWSVDGALICSGSTVGLDGYIDCTHVFTSSGAVVLSLQVTNPNGGSATSDISLSVTPNTAPSIDIISPLSSDGIFYSNYPITFSSTVSDNEDAAEVLVVTWASDQDGLLSVSGTPDSAGLQSGTGPLLAGAHVLTATVTDTTGLATETQTSIVVNGPNTPPDCEILAPLDNEVYEEGEPILLSGRAVDVDIGPDQLAVTWSSDKDGDLATVTPNSDGESLYTVDTLSLTNHTLTMLVVDEKGESCTDTVLVKVGSGPSLIIKEPTSGTLLNENEPVTFKASVTDNQDDPDELVLSWSSDLEGVFSAQGADSSGNITFSYSLEIGSHTITASATDTDALTTTASTTLTINDLPSAPSISIAPNPPASNENFSTSIDSPSFDAEGHSMTYRYAWTVNGTASTVTSAQVPASSTTRGEYWEVTVTPSDGYGDGDPVTSAVTVGNAAPVMSSVGLTPDPAREGDTLACTPLAVDNDGDSITYAYSWTVNSSALSETGSTLTSSFFDRGDAVYCTVTPSDATDTGASMSSSVLTISNAIPELASASLTPTSAYEATTLTCAAGTTSDADGDTVTVSYAWVVNAVTITPTISTLTGTYFDKGDEVYCTVTPSDGTDSGAPVSSNTVTIDNTQPSLSSASLSPSGGVVEATTLICAAGTTSDDDPSDTVSVRYSWTIDGGTISVTGTSLTGSYFDKGDVVACVVTPNDGTIDGAPVTSNTVTVGNTAPSATSVSLSPSSIFTEDDIVAQVTGWNDVDGDTEGYIFAWYVNSSLVTGDTDDTLDYTRFVKDDVVYVIATPYDGTDTGSALTSSVDTVLNTPPGAPTVLVGPTDAEPDDTLECTITAESYDADGDPITYTYAWFLDGTATGITSSTVSPAYTADDETWNCTATPSDGDDTGTPGSDSQVVADRTAPNAPVLDSIDPYRNATSVTVSGTAEAGSAVQVYFDCDSGTTNTTITADSSGNWSVSDTVTQGDFCEYYAYATDDSGNTSGISNTVSTESCAQFDDYEDSSGYGDACSYPINEWGVLADDGSATISFVGNIIDSTDSDWYVISTAQSVTTSGTNTFNFDVAMLSGSSDYAFAVYYGSCAKSDLVCSGQTDFDYYNADDGDGTNHTTPSDTRYCANGSTYDNCADYSGDYYIEVFRTTGGYDCTAYELEITNGVW